MKKIAPSPQQKAVKDWVVEEDGSLVIEAVAGSGKTTLLIHILPFTKGNVAFAAYNKAIAVEISDRVAPLNLGNRVNTGTCHSFGYAALRAAFPKTKLDAKKLDIISKEIIEDWSLRNFAKSAVTMAKQVGIGLPGCPASWTEMIAHFSLYEKLPDGADFHKALKLAQNLLRLSNEKISTMIDFDDMIYGPLVKNLSFKKYDWVFLDEAQDANFCRRTLMHKMLAPGGRFVAVGDKHQAIYGFTGADHRSLDNISEMVQAKHLPLDVTFRCPKSVVQVAQQWMPGINAHDSAPEGTVDSAYVQDLIREGGFKGQDAVLCRNTKPLIELAYQLIREDVPCRVEGRAIGEGLVKLATRWKRVKTVSQLEDQLDVWFAREVQKAIEKEENDRCASLEDQVGTLRIFLEQCEPEDSIDVVVMKIRTMFSDSDGKQRQDILTLSTIHRAKGREWDRVFALEMDRYSPSRWAKKDWELQQENNLMYVQVTRAKKHLTFLTPGSSPTDPDKILISNTIKELTAVNP